jgi:hypothetical protein
VSLREWNILLDTLREMTRVLHNVIRDQAAMSERIRKLEEGP